MVDGRTTRSYGRVYLNDVGTRQAFVLSESSPFLLFRSTGFGIAKTAIALSLALLLITVSECERQPLGAINSIVRLAPPAGNCLVKS